VQGEVDPETGMVADLRDLDEAIRESVIEPMDHAFLNALPEFSGGLIPTTENVARVVWDRLAPRLPDGCLLDRVRVIEDRTLWADYRGA
jgi:6-pyruvoyltetrahydropterin/6-carboxytetrahydropterin synthase